MKKNGFIATSLIYSFFLIFITLFLTIIVDYIQNKINLEYQESSVKAKLNNVLTARDFEPGDYVLFDPDCSGVPESTGEEYIVAAVYFKNKEMCDPAKANEYDCVILYSYDLFSSCSSPVTAKDINTHIDISYKNSTKINEILYTFNTCGDVTKYSSQPCPSAVGKKNSYLVSASGSYPGRYPTLNADPSSVTEDLMNFTTKKGSLALSGNTLYRTKKTIIFDTGTKKNRQSCKGSSKGTYYLKKDVATEL